MKTMGAGEFKAKCLGVLDEVKTKRQPVVVTKNGRPVARMVPMPQSGEDPIFGFYRGNLEFPGDIFSPIYSEEEWEEFLERSAEQLK